MNFDILGMRQRFAGKVKSQPEQNTAPESPVSANVSDPWSLEESIRLSDSFGWHLARAREIIEWGPEQEPNNSIALCNYAAFLEHQSHNLEVDQWFQQQLLEKAYQFLIDAIDIDADLDKEEPKSEALNNLIWLTRKYQFLGVSFQSQPKSEPT